MKLKVSLNHNQESELIANVLFEVLDTGIGIDKANQKAIFQPFTQETASTVKQFIGTGLGLTISKLLVELMGGEIWVESQPEKGSTFSFIVPFKKSKNQDLEAETKPRKGLSHSSTKSKEKEILLVEDNEINQSIFKMSLERLGSIVMWQKMVKRV